MAIDDTEAPAPQPGMHPALASFRQIFDAPAAQEWADQATTIVNDHIQRARIADANQAAGDQFVNNLAQFRDGLKSWVAKDPTAVHSAINLAGLTVAHLIANNPSHPEDQAQDTHQQIAGELQSDIARSAIQSMAERDDGAARSLLDHPNVGGRLGESDRGDLSAYINLQHMARGADNAARQKQAADQYAQASNGMAAQHLLGLYDPQTNAPAFPPGWATSLMTNSLIQPQDKQGLMNAYGRLQTGGDAPMSDPFLVSDMVNRIANGRPISAGELIGNVGHSLRLGDAASLASGVIPLNTAQQNHYGQMNDTLQRAKAMLMGPNGENGVAGQAAYGRFVNWMLPAMRSGGAAMNVPEAHPLNWVHRFLPSGDDVVAAPTGERRPLSEIFGSRK